VKTFLFFLVLAAFAPRFALADSVITPEPNTLALMVTGLAAIGFTAWRANRKK
jgi:hypothetical protein